MIGKSMEKALNDQFIMELESSNLYLSMCSYFIDKDLDGFANFYRLQAHEEYDHAMRIFDYVHEVDGKIEMRAIAAIQTSFNSNEEVLKITLDHEKKVSKSIYDLVAQSLDERDYATHTMLQWFITEQVEEESLIKGYLQKVRMVGESNSALYLLNEELGQRKAETPDSSK